MQILKRKILSLNDYAGRSERASHIEYTLSKLRVTIYRVMEKEEKESYPKVVDMPIMDRVNLPRIEVPKFDGSILNWRRFWEQF